MRDGLTGLYNRRFLKETLAREISQAERDETPLMVSIIDIDHFKNVNDTHGHGTGDAVLKAADCALYAAKAAGRDWVAGPESTQ